jgi:type IV secretion system protein VirB11
VWETKLPNHSNHVHLFYEADGARERGVTVDQLLRATLRMRPDRPILSEIRGAEAFDFLTSVMSGHPGALTSIHASSAYGVIDRLAFLIEASGRRFTRELLESVIFSTVDVICQFAVGYEDGVKRRWISEIYYDPERKRKLMMKSVF